MELVKIESEGELSYYTVEFDDGREAFLTLKNNEEPPRVIKGHAIGVLTAEETLATVDEASDWLLNHLW